MANGDDLIQELSRDIGFLRASPEEQRQYLAFKDPDYASKTPEEQETRRQAMHNQAVLARSARPTEFERTPSATRGYLANLGEAAIPRGSPLGIPGYSHVKAAYDIGMAGVRGAQASRARGEPWYRNLASAGAPVINLNEEQVRRAGEAGDIPGILGAITPAAALAVLPFIGRGREGVDRRAPVDRRALPPGGGGGGGRPGGPGGPGGPGAPPPEGPRGPTATDTLDAAAHRMFPGSRWDDLSQDQRMDVMRGGGAGGPSMAEDIVPRGTIPPTGGGRVALAPTPKPRPLPPGAKPEDVMFNQLFGPYHEEAAQLAEWETGSREGKTPEPLFRMGEQMGLRVAKAPGLADVYIPKGMADAEIPGFVAQQHALERQMKPGLPGQPGQPGGGLPTTQGVPPVPGQPGLTPAPSGATITPAHGTRPAAPALQDLLRGWGGEQEGTLPPVRPEEPPPKK